MLQKKVIAPKPVEVKKAAPVKPVMATPVVKPASVPAVKSTPAPKPVSTERTRYPDAELEEFRTLITSKLEAARAELINLQAQIINANENGTDDTGSSFKMLEDGSDTLAKEEAANLAARQKKF